MCIEIKIYLNKSKKTLSTSMCILYPNSLQIGLQQIGYNWI